MLSVFSRVCVLWVCDFKEEDSGHPPALWVSIFWAGSAQVSDSSEEQETHWFGVFGVFSSVFQQHHINVNTEAKTSDSGTHVGQQYRTFLCFISGLSFSTFLLKCDSHHQHTDVQIYCSTIVKPMIVDLEPGLLLKNKACNISLHPFGLTL